MHSWCKDLADFWRELLQQLGFKRRHFKLSRVGAALLLLALPAQAGTPRSSKVLRDFVKAHPCPSSGKNEQHCPGWRIDHVVPLCWDPSQDVVSNLAWQEEAQSYRKDAFEREACALRKKDCGR